MVIQRSCTGGRLATSCIKFWISAAASAVVMFQISSLLKSALSFPFLLLSSLSLSCQCLLQDSEFLVELLLLCHAVPYAVLVCRWSICWEVVWCRMNGMSGRSKKTTGNPGAWQLVRSQARCWSGLCGTLCPVGLRRWVIVASPYHWYANCSRSFFIGILTDRLGNTWDIHGKGDEAASDQQTNFRRLQK